LIKKRKSKKSDWQTKKLEDSIEKVVYPNKIPRKKFLVSGIFPVISQEADFINGYWDDAADVFKVGAPVIIFGDHTQVLKYVDHDFVLGADGVKILKPKKFLGARFFYYFLQSIDLKNLGYARHYRLLKEIEISYPESLSEQCHIVKKLDKIFADIEKAKQNAQKNLQNAREFFESYLQGTLAKPGKGWGEKRLGDVFEIQRGGSPRPIQKYLTDDENGINWIKIGDTQGISKYIYKTRQKIKPEGVRRSRLVKEGDFILSNSMSFGRPYIMKTTGCIHDGWLLLREKTETVDKNYLYFMLGSSLVFRQFDKLAAGSTVRNLNIGLVKSVIIPIPPLSEQKRIVAKLDALSAKTKKLEVIYQQKLADLEELKKAVLNKAFAGEL